MTPLPWDETLRTDLHILQGWLLSFIFVGKPLIKCSAIDNNCSFLENRSIILKKKTVTILGECYLANNKNWV